jgi:hypothetical protein
MTSEQLKKYVKEYDAVQIDATEYVKSIKRDLCPGKTCAFCEQHTNTCGM